MGWKSVLLPLLSSYLLLWHVCLSGIEAFVVTRGPLFAQRHHRNDDDRRQREFSSAAVQADGYNSGGDPYQVPHTNSTQRSCIRAIRSRNLGGVVSATCSTRDGSSSDDVVICFPPNEQLITITGETGTGKSLLFARVMELITGGNAKGFSSLIVSSARGELVKDTEAFAQVELELHEPWCSAVDAMLQTHFQHSLFHNNNTLVLRRTLLGRRRRISSTCTINGRTVSLKVLASLAAPLLKVVDAAAAASALVRPAARLAVIDTAVDPILVRQVQQRRALFRQFQRERQLLEHEIADFPYDPAEDSAEMLQHWIDELDVFSERVTKLCRSVAIRDDASFSDDDDDEEEVSTISRVMQHMMHVAWDGRVPKNDDDDDDTPSMHNCLVQLRNELRSLDEQMVSTRNAINALSLLSVPNSAATALEQARKFLLDISTDNREILEATEASHEYLNRLEDSLTSCTRFLEDDDKGLLQKLECNRANYPVSVDQLEEILFEWGSLARKHGIQPERLAACHISLRNEQDGGDEARARLPRLQAAEEAALADLDVACADLHHQREEIAKHLGGRVTERLGSLGMEDSTLRVHVKKMCNATDALATGYDTAHFIIEKSDRSTKQRKQGEMSSVASSGEKARLLLAIECVLPGSVAAATTASTAGSNSGDYQDPNSNLQQQITLPPPVAVLYDEIDAHVGGQAAVALSHMLRDQAEQSSQVLAITHSPPVAAVADLHVVVQKEQFGSVCAKVLNPTERRQELARMASGNVAAEEALLFADALLREGVRNVSNV